MRIAFSLSAFLAYTFGWLVAHPVVPGAVGMLLLIACWVKVIGRFSPPWKVRLQWREDLSPPRQLTKDQRETIARFKDYQMKRQQGVR